MAPPGGVTALGMAYHRACHATHASPKIFDDFPAKVYWLKTSSTGRSNSRASGWEILTAIMKTDGVFGQHSGKGYGIGTLKTSNPHNFQSF